MTALLKEREFHIGRFFCVLFILFFLTMRGGARRVSFYSNEEVKDEKLPWLVREKRLRLTAREALAGRKRFLPADRRWKKKDEELSARTKITLPLKGRWGFSFIFRISCIGYFFIFENNGISVVFDGCVWVFWLSCVQCFRLLDVMSIVFLLREVLDTGVSRRVCI